MGLILELILKFILSRLASVTVTYNKRLWYFVCNKQSYVFKPFKRIDLRAERGEFFRLNWIKNWPKHEHLRPGPSWTSATRHMHLIQKVLTAMVAFLIIIYSNLHKIFGRQVRIYHSDKAVAIFIHVSDIRKGNNIECLKVTFYLITCFGFNNRDISIIFRIV